MKLAAFQAAQAYSGSKAALKPDTLPTETSAKKPEADPGGAFKAVHELTTTVAQGEQAANSFMTGNADPHSVVEAMAAAELAVETAVTVRDKVVEAYQELIRMPI